MTHVEKNKMFKEKKMNNNFSIPIVGLGTYKPNRPGEVVEAVSTAIDAGYRHFDCAWIYENEAEVGEAIRKSIKDKTITREEVFVTTKLWNNFHDRKKVMEMLRKSLKEMKLTYVDLFLMHWPMGFKEDARKIPLDETDAFSEVDYLETWKGMEECVDCGFARSIGLANFNTKQITRILKYAKVKPVVNYIEVHYKFVQKKLLKFCQEHDIVVIAYCPLAIVEPNSGNPGFLEFSIDDKNIKSIAYKYHKTPQQIVLNYLVSHLGVCVVPKSVSKIRINEYINIFDFMLDQYDIAYLESCNTNERICPFIAFHAHKYYPFHEVM